jgi:hypothetical protein
VEELMRTVYWDLLPLLKASNKRRPWLISAVVLQILSMSALSHTAIAKTQVWLAAVDPVMSAYSGLQPSGYLDLFEPGANWQAGASGLQVFETSTQFLATAQDEQIKQMLSGLALRHIKLAVSGLMLTGTDRCGHHVEGYSGPRIIEHVAARVKQLGSTIDYMVMDEPLLYGHLYQGPSACRDSITDVARQVAEKVGQIEAVFPAIKVGDSEVISTRAEGELLAPLNEWLSAYQTAVGEPLAFVQVDLNWTNPHWPNDLRSVASLLHAANVPLGIIYNGSREDTSDLEWTTHAEQHFKYIESVLRIVPEYAIIQTWTQRPSRLLPEMQQGTLTNVLRQYLQWRAQATGR